MITQDQPSIFPDELLVRVSSKNNGTMLDRTQGTHSPDALANRRRFCDLAGVNYDDVVYQQIVYADDQTYDRLREVDRSDRSLLKPQVPADGLITGTKNVGIMLPVADCVATTIYDPVTRRMAVLHLGRHSTVAGLMKKTLDELVGHGSDATDLLVYMSPSAQKEHYVMRYFDHADEPAWQLFCERRPDGFHLDLAGFNRQACIDAGVLPDHIEASTVDTVTSDDYFSHLRGDVTKRFVLVAMIR